MEDSKEKVKIIIEMTEAQAEATAEFYKRMGHDDYLLKANEFHSTELENMKRGGNRIREALANAGFDPR